MQATLKNNIITKATAFVAAKPDLRGNEKQRSDFVSLYALAAILLHAQTILFPTEQAEVFAELSHEYTDKLDYALPFDQCLLEFMAPVKIGDRKLLGIALNQDEFDKKDFEVVAAKHILEGGDPVSLPDKAEIHQAIGIYEDGYSSLIWKVHDKQMFFDTGIGESERLKNLAIACIGYINCENITLEKHATDEKVNRKRLSKGKKPLDAYYTTKIKGYQYSAKESKEPTGRHVSFRFDVRGHFRHLQSGKTIWITAHQRGLEHELYKPKIYVAE